MADEQDTSAFVGVSDIYKNYADDTTKPFLPDDTDERKAYEDQLEAEKASVVDDGTDKGRVEDTDKADDKADDDTATGGEPTGGESTDNPPVPEAPKAETRTTKARTATKSDPDKA